MCNKVFCSTCQFAELKQGASDNAAAIEYSKCGSPNKEDSFWAPVNTKPWCSVKNRGNDCTDYVAKQQ